MAARIETAMIAQGSGGEATIGTHQECRYTAAVDLTAGSTTAVATPCLLYGIYVNTTVSAHVTVIKDGSTTVLSLPSAAPAGSVYTLPGIRFETSLVVDPDNSTSAGSITLAYRLL